MKNKPKSILVDFGLFKPQDFKFFNRFKKYNKLLKFWALYGLKRIKTRRDSFNWILVSKPKLLQNLNFWEKNWDFGFQTKIQLNLSQRVCIQFRPYRAQNFRNLFYFLNLLKNLKSCGLNKPKSTKIDFGLFLILVYLNHKISNFLTDLENRTNSWNFEPYRA